jgi:hypothetical protein
LLTLAAAACGGGARPSPRDAADAADTGGTLPARSASEQSILQQVPQLPAGATRTVGDSQVIAEPAYHSASGRTCRALSITEGKQKQASHRLACTEGKTWFFVPDVLGLEATAE